MRIRLRCSVRTPEIQGYRNQEIDVDETVGAGLVEKGVAVIVPTSTHEERTVPAPADAEPAGAELVADQVAEDEASSSSSEEEPAKPRRRRSRKGS